MIKPQYFTKDAKLTGNLTIKKETDKLSFSAGNVEGSINLKNGQLETYHIKTQPQSILQMPEPYFWRAPTDNDFGNHMPEEMGIWRNAHANTLLKSISVGEKSSEGLAITVDY